MFHQPTTGALIERWYAAALAAVEPAAAVQRLLARDGDTLIVDGRRVPVRGKLIIAAIGKAAVAMARGAEAVCGDLITGGLVITKDGHAGGVSLAYLPIREAAHPVLDERGVAATRELLALLTGLGSADVVLALISGGGSALLEAPHPPLTLADMAATTDLLLRAGAPIQDLNAVRTPLSLVKGGGLRRAAGAATVVTLILSDVLGNDPRIIASGPTVPGEADPAVALAILDRYGVRERVPSVVIQTLLMLPSPPQPPSAAVERGGSRTAEVSLITIVGDNDAAVGAAAAAARADGFHTDIIWRERRGEAVSLARAWVAACERADPAVEVLLGGGEATVTVRGDGVGGRKTEFALAAALTLAERDDHDWIVASLATDGQDALTGVAGAIADAETIARARTAGVDPIAALANNDSLRVFEAAGGTERPGPTGTNVCDLYFAVRASRKSGDRSQE